MFDLNITRHFAYIRAMSPALPLSAAEIRAVRALAEHRRTAQAAEALNLSQSALSRHVRAAEERLGITLFQRGWSGTDTTAAGDVVARQCQRVLNRIEAFDAAHPPARLAALARWRHLRAVSACVRAGSASAAAQALGMRQPAVSQALSEVAGYAGQPLFARRRDGLQALPVARDLAFLWQEVAQELGALAGLLDSSTTGLSGRVAVGMLPFSGQNLVIEAFAEMTRDHPRLRLVAVPGGYSMLVDALQRGEIDLIMGTLRVPPPPGLTEEWLYDEEYVMIARRDHPCHDGPLTLEALAGLNWSVAPHGTPVRRYFEAFFLNAPRPPQTQSVEIFSFANAEQMSLGSESVAMLCYNRERLARLNPELKRLDVTLPDPRVPVGLTRRADTPAPAAVDVFVACLRRHIAALGLV
ncbi:LysR family transcriptional regulator [Pararhodobacter sp.]|uniref:LysR family transcriptional regulator n=1 Tax=Pararhodobacter sp. TaxID=2127056 RepID=UPI002AFEFD65|nr:LysR substrate-binding domain-containing protein [Pararhodobacter sp.]